ncbi:hypothetical protein Droror1_Dr00027715 [Drosera rotundifolia]
MARSFEGTDSQAMTLTVVKPKKFWNDFHFRVQWVQGTSAGMYQYFVKIVPTVYTNVRGYTICSNQFSVTEHFRSSQSGHYVPGVFFFYNISPIKVTFTEKHMSFLHFIKNVCHRRRYIYSFWNSRLCCLSWSEGDKKEDTVGQIQLMC